MRSRKRKPDEHEPAGADDIPAKATPGRKLDFVRAEQAQGRPLPMGGRRSNGAPAILNIALGQPRKKPDETRPSRA